MINTDAFKKCCKVFVIIVAVVVSIPILLIAAYNLALWPSTGFNPDYAKIDTCLDLGGRWNYEIRACEGSKFFKSRKQDTTFVRSVLRG